MASNLQRRAQNQNRPQHAVDGFNISPKAHPSSSSTSAVKKCTCISVALLVIALIAVYSKGLKGLKTNSEFYEIPSKSFVDTNVEGREFSYFRQGQSNGKEDQTDVKGILPGIPSIPRSHDDIHIIFSTDCSDYQNWQSLLFFYSAGRAGQKGPVTRLASGCSDEEILTLREIHKYLPKSHSIHFTPDFSLDALTGKRYPYYNKPRALQHFLANMNPPIAETVIALLDPDMILFRPLQPFIDTNTNLFNEDLRPVFNGLVYWVSEGHPLGQHYGLGGVWASWDDLKGIVEDPTSPALDVPPKDAGRHYPVGPPYFAHVRDMQKLADKWVEFVPRTFLGHPGILSEMYAFCIAAAHLKLPHLVITDFMVSDTEVSSTEGWSEVEKLKDEDVCQALDSDMSRLGTEQPKSRFSALLHYCHVFRCGIYMFGKHRAELLNIFSCDSHYLLEPPSYVGTLHVKVHPNKRIDHLSRPVAVRNAFALCAATKILNAALRDYRKAVCSPDVYKAGLKNVIKLTDLRPQILEDIDHLKDINAI